MNDVLGARRIVIVGMAGAGKSTLGKRLSALTAIPYVELDSLYWGPNWEPRLPEFRDDVVRVAAGESWITDGNYSTIRELLWPHAQLVIWLNLSFTTIFRRVFMRTMQRTLRGTELWQGNRESWRRSFMSRESILWWVIKNWKRSRRQFGELRASGKYAQLQWVELKTPRELEGFIETLR